MSQNITASKEVEYVLCPVCSHDDSYIWRDEGRGTKYVRCNSCKTVYASPRLTREARFSWIDNTFSFNNDVLHLTGSRISALQTEAKYMQKFVMQGKMLDIGCSLGALFEFFQPDCWERYGVELSPSAARYAANKYKCNVSVGTLQNAKYLDQEFDLVSIIDTLYYLDSPNKELAEIKRILKPGGFLAIEIAGQAYSLMRNYGLMPFILDRRWSRADSDSSYINWFSPLGLKRLLETNGFQPLEWFVISSPSNKGLINRFIINIYYKTLKRLSERFTRSITWAPKYLCVSRSLP